MLTFGRTRRKILLIIETNLSFKVIMIKFYVDL